MELHQKQKEVINSTKRYKLLNWGRRTGKTTVVGYENFITLFGKDNALCSYYAPTRDDARDIAWEMFKDTLKGITKKTNDTFLEIYTSNKFGTTSLLKLQGWEAVKNRDKGRGVENDLVTLDEVAFFPMFEEKYDKVIEPTLLTSKGRLIATSTPNGFNHFYKMAQRAQRDTEWFYSHATSYDNPFNDPLELERLRAAKNEDSFAQEYLADFRKVEGLVYKEFDQERHYLTAFPKGVIESAQETRGCIDFGFTNPTAMYSILRSKDGIYYVFDEYQETGKVQDELNQLMQARKVRSWYPDPAEPDRIEMMRRAGLRTNEVSKDVTAGINTVQTLFKQNRLFVVGCPQLLFELNFYKWREKTSSAIDQNEPEEPIKEHDHGLDAIRYALHMWEANSGAPKEDVYITEDPIFADIGI